MKLTKPQINLLLALLGIVLALVAYLAIYNPGRTDIAELEAENETLNARLAILKEYDANRETYISEANRMMQDKETILAEFTNGLLTEDKIMYYFDAENTAANEIAISAISMDTSDTAVVYSPTQTADGFTPVDDGILLYGTNTGINMKTTYAGFKNFVDYIYRVGTRKAITNVSLSAGDDGYLNGSMNVSFYYVITTSDESTAGENITGVETGVDNIFGSLDGEETTQEEN